MSSTASPFQRTFSLIRRRVQTSGRVFSISDAVSPASSIPSAYQFPACNQKHLFQQRENRNLNPRSHNSLLPHHLLTRLSGLTHDRDRVSSHSMSRLIIASIKCNQRSSYLWISSVKVNFHGNTVKGHSCRDSVKKKNIVQMG